MQYCELPDITIGGYDFSFDEDNNISPVTMTLQQYAEAVFNTSTDTFILNGTIITSRIIISSSEIYITILNHFATILLCYRAIQCYMWAKC